MPSLSSFLLSDPLPVLRLGDHGPAVSGLRQLLAKCDRTFGVKGIPVGDTFDTHIEALVRIFQFQVFLHQDGVVGPETWKALQVDSPKHMPTVQSGIQSMAVCQIQKRLRLYSNCGGGYGSDYDSYCSGYYGGALDGEFGRKTHRAVIEFQQGQEITADGVVGPITWHRLSQI